jgi:multiple sugar transport system ATP-binding protein
MIYFDVANITLCASISPDSGARPQTTMPISVNMNQMHLFDRESGRSLRT